MLLEDDDARQKLTMPEENDKPRMLVKSLDDLDATAKAKAGASGSRESFSSSRSTFGSGRASIGEDGDKDKEKIKSATFGSLSIDDLKGRMVKNEATKRGWDDLPKRTEDLNGINPVTTILFSAFPAVVCYLLTTLASYLTNNFAVQYLNSELYPVQRIAIVARNLVVGLVTLGGGFCGIIAVGLLVLGVTVAVGVAKGELDPNAENSTGNVK